MWGSYFGARYFGPRYFGQGEGLLWPTVLLPAAMLAPGYAIEAPSGVIRTDMDTGLARQRKPFSTPPLLIRVAWMMDGDQLAFFKSWLAWRAGEGAVFFRIDLALDAAAPSRVRARIVGDTAYALVRPGRWRVEAELEVKSAPPLTAAEVDAILGE